VAGLAALIGCVSIHSLGPLVDQTLGLPAKTADQLSQAASDYFECCGKWPASMNELQSPPCDDGEKRRKIADDLAAIPADALANQVVFRTLPDGQLTISMSFPGRTVTTNGSSVTWSGGDFTATLGMPTNPTASKSVNIESH
jgi:hypothetical protein